jgi:hypothetical protein
LKSEPVNVVFDIVPEDSYEDEEYYDEDLNGAEGVNEEENEDESEDDARIPVTVKVEKTV